MSSSSGQVFKEVAGDAFLGCCIPSWNRKLEELLGLDEGCDHQRAGATGLAGRATWGVIESPYPRIRQTSDEVLAVASEQLRKSEKVIELPQSSVSPL